jgi:hypothetical protein
MVVFCDFVGFLCVFALFFLFTFYCIGNKIHDLCLDYKTESLRSHYCE